MRFVGCFLLFLLLSGETFAQDDSTRIRLRDNNPNEPPRRPYFDLKSPPNVETTYTYDSNTGMYLEQIIVGGRPVGNPRVMSVKEYSNMMEKRDREKYFRQKSDATRFVRGSGLIPDFFVAPPLFDKFFGGGAVDIRPTGSAEITFGGRINEVRNPALPVRQQKTGQFDFDMRMQLNVVGKIGDRVNLNWNYNTEATFEFENQMKLNWEGDEDDILKNIELGNVGLPLNGTLIQGGQNLFGIKSELQFGKLRVATIITQQRGERKETELNGRSQITPFNIQASDYDVNRHFFLSQFFRDQYDRALATLPLVQSAVLINYVEVWVTNRANMAGMSRDVTGFMDLGEADPHNQSIVRTGTNNFPDNDVNNLYGQVRNQPFCEFNLPNLREGQDYECLGNARQLTPADFKVNQRLGYISLNQTLNNDEVLMVAFEYTYNGRRFQVGEFSRDVASVGVRLQPLVLKLIKPTTIRTELPMWDLMMKNIYSLNSFNVQAEDFNLNVVYADDRSGADLNYLPVESSETNVFEKQLIDVLNLDKINRQNEPRPDGIFDLVEGITFNSSQGQIIFPVLEPFGKHLASQLRSQENIDYYTFPALYDSTKWLAELNTTQNKFFLVGRFQGSASDVIRLQCFNLTPGTVRVTANGSPLREGADFIVDYAMGTVRMTNEAILNSGAVIRASCESQALMNLQQKSLLGTRLDYRHSSKLLIGGTFMHMSERPLTPKVNIGEEPLLNSIWGFDINYNSESRFLTKLVDKIPLISTKEISTVSFTGEFAHLIPHKPRTIGERGTFFIDDFEAAETPYDLKFHHNWHLAATPQGQPDLFPETALGDSFYNSQRANLSWYSIDVLFQSDQRITPDNIRNNPALRSDHFVRSVPITEVFPTFERQQGQPNQLITLDLAYYPNERGQYNMNPEILNEDGTLTNPAQKWGGISRKIETNDFEATNIDYIEMWMMDPFVYEKALGRTAGRGQLYINLGNISEDVLPDRRRSAENGLPGRGTQNQDVETTRFAKVPVIQILNKAFDSDPESMAQQDKGLDGMNDDEEREFFQNYIDRIGQIHGTNSQAYINALNDPSGDNYVFFKDPTYDNQNANILRRYSKFRGLEGNNTVDRLDDGTPMSAYVNPDDEDINDDHSVNTIEEYFQYKIEINPNDLVIGRNFVTDSIIVEASQVDPGVLPNEIVWYQLKIPVREFDKAVGGIRDFKSIRFMRMFMKGFEDTSILRFANLQLIRADWRRYLNDLKFPPNVGPPINPDLESKLVISTVNIIENSQRQPIPYDMPPGFDRIIDPTQPGAVQMNEQSLSVQVCDLERDDARGAFKILDFDFRNYEFIKMFIHAESEFAEDDDVVAFIRLGTDLENNYYQYEIPLKLTPYGSFDQSAIWPEENELNIRISDFYDAKINRFQIYQNNVAFHSEVNASGHTISVVGLPDMGNVRSILLGVKNAGNSSQERLCAEVWFNELRVNGIANKSGIAATGRLVTKLADFGMVTLTGNYQSIGFGGVHQRLNDRNLDEVIQYDISSSFELGKFFPAKSGISIPMFIGYNENILNPKFFPLNPDLELKSVLRAAETRERRNEIKRAAQDYTSRFSINFTNVKKNRMDNSQKARIWDIENFNYTFSYQSVNYRNQMIERNDIDLYQTSLAYNFASQAKPWEPFKKLIKSRKLNLIKDFNLNFVPQSINIRTDVDRRYAELVNRSNDNFVAIVPIMYDKTFSFNRIYSFNWNLAKSLKIDYNATASSWVEEPIGAIDTREKRDSIRDNFLGLGTLRDFNQSFNVNYTLPFKKVKMLDWINTTARYSSSFMWQTAPPAFLDLGNTIQNSSTLGVNGNTNFTALYNKIPFLRKINQPPRRKPPKKDNDTTEKKKEMSEMTKNVFKFLMMLKQGQFTYNQTNGTLLPGFQPLARNFGNDFNMNAPGIPFILGNQEEDFRFRMAQGGLLSNDTNQNNPFTKLTSTDFNASLTIEPFKEFRINVTFTERKSFNISSNFRFNSETNQFEDLMFNEFGSYQGSFVMLRTAFQKTDSNLNSAVFDQFLNNRFLIADRLQREELTNGVNADRYGQFIGQIDDSTGMPVGYNQNNQDVLIYSFLAAYSGEDVTKMNLNLFDRIPLPNWRINYTGLSKLKWFKDNFSNISITHAYSSTINMNAYSLDLDYGFDELERGGNLKTRYRFEGGISLMERLSPLLGLNFTMNNGLNVRLEYKTDRTITFNTISFQMVEMMNEEYVIGVGYRGNEIRLPIKYNGANIFLENDLNFRFDFSIRDGITIVRQINTEQYTATAGIRSVAIRPNLDYMISDQLNLRLFYTRNVNNPKVRNSFPTALTEFGVAFRYTMM
jgi:cell surface protein SprA